MTIEEKELLLRDLCVRLPYSTLCYCKWTKDAPNNTSGCVQEVSTYLLEELMIIGDPNYECQICEIKPYLRPMSSMMEKELKDLLAYSGIGEHEIEICKYDGGAELEFWLNEVPCKCIGKVIDWLNKKMFDYRGLIEKGLALEAPEDMYKLNKKSMIIIEATVKYPNSRGGGYVCDVERKVFKDDDIESVQNFLNKDFCYPYDKNECSVNFNYLKL